MTGDSPRSMVLASLGVHVILVGAFVLMFSFFERPDLDPEPVNVVFYKPGEYVEPEPPPPIPEPEPEPEPEPKPEPVIAEAEPEPEPDPVPIPPKPEPEPVNEVHVAQVQPRPEPEPPKPVLQPKPEPPKRKRPRREVQTNVLNAAVPKPAARLQTDRREVQTNAFGSGEKETPVHRERVRAGTQVGNFVVASDAETQAPKTRRATVQSGGFGSAEAAESPRKRGDGGSVATGGFGSTPTASERKRTQRKVQQEAPDTPVEILSKPTPVYTSQARDLRIEGEVSLRVTFVAGGTVKVLNVIDGLGHGLDEAAIEAAKRIRFKPARRDGQPVDHTATLRIVFQLV